MHEIGCSGLVHWDDSEGWNVEEGGGGIQDGEHMYTCGRFKVVLTIRGQMQFLGGGFFYLCKKVIGIFLGIILHL